MWFVSAAIRGDWRRNNEGKYECGQDGVDGTDNAQNTQKTLYKTDTG